MTRKKTYHNGSYIRGAALLGLLGRVFEQNKIMFSSSWALLEIGLILVLQDVAKGLGHLIAGMTFRLPMIFSQHFVVHTSIILLIG